MVLSPEVSVGKNTGDIYGTNDLNNPNYTFRRGAGTTYLSLRLSASTSCLSASGQATYQHRGFPRSRACRWATNRCADEDHEHHHGAGGTTRLPDSTSWT
jgi:hypothetical protein